MTDANWFEEAIGAIDEQLNALDGLVRQAAAQGDYAAGRANLKWWKDRTAEILTQRVSERDGEGFRAIRPMFVLGPAGGQLRRAAEEHRSFLLSVKEDLQRQAALVLGVSASGSDAGPSGAVGRHVDRRTVFIAYGRDRANAHGLERLLEREWQLKPKLLSREAGGGRHLMEALEDEAGRAGYAFVLMTPDDRVANEGEQPYQQARPNVVLELGWLYGKLGRGRVCILLKKGTRVPSDVHGIKYVDFTADINERYQEIRGELMRAEVIGGADRTSER